MPVLKVTDQKSGKQKVISIFKKVTSIGSSPDNDVVITGPGIEKNHANIFFESGNATIQSAQASYKVLLDGAPIRRKKIPDKGMITIGWHTIQYMESLAQEPAPPGKKVEIEANAYKRMFDLSNKLLTEYRIEPLLENIMDSVIELTGADKGLLILTQGGGLKVRVARNLNRENIKDAIEKVSDSIVDKVLKTRQPLIVSDALHDAQFNSSESVVNLKLCSVLCVPLVHKGEIFGLIYAGNDRVINRFDESALRTLIIFSAQVSLILQSALRLDEAETSARNLTAEIERMQFGEVIGTAPAMQEVFRQASRVAPADVHVILEGEKGTGKELIAREIHRRSPRSKGPFVTLNCSAMPAELIRSELYGYVRGAFQGAVATKHGKFQQAHHGTLFIDEIENASPELQSAIISALREKTVTKVGDTHHEEIDVRVVAACDTGEEIPPGNKLFESLPNAFGAFRITLPALRDREGDIILIARYLLQKYSKEFESKASSFINDAIDAMKRYRWPGNIREMENRIKKAVILSTKAAIGPEDLGIKDIDDTPLLTLAQAREEFQARYIHEALARNNGNRTKTARELGVDPRTVFRYLEKIPGAPPAPGDEE